MYLCEREREIKGLRGKSKPRPCYLPENHFIHLSLGPPRGVGAQAANLAHWGCSTPPDFPFVQHTEFWKEQSGADPSSSLLVWKERPHEENRTLSVLSTPNCSWVQKSTHYSTPPRFPPQTAAVLPPMPPHPSMVLNKVSLPKGR